MNKMSESGFAGCKDEHDFKMKKKMMTHYLSKNNYSGKNNPKIIYDFMAKKKSMKF
jgi:hypothetical protein